MNELGRDNRPLDCPDKSCKYFRQRSPAKEGASGWCTGRLSEGFAEAVGDFLHINNLSLCIFDGGDRPPARFFTRVQDLVMMGSDLSEWAQDLALEEARQARTPRKEIDP